MKSELLKKIAQSLRESDARAHSKNLREAPEPEKEEGEDSLDAQVDKYLADYEAEAKNSKMEGLDFRMMSRRFLLEAEDEEEDKKEDKEEDKSEEDKEPKQLTSDDINIKSFLADVMRLIDNYDTLLEVQNTILRRTANFLSKNYEKDVLEAFKEQLLDAYGLEIGKTQSEREDEIEYQPPKAAAAGPLGGGGT